MFHPLRVRASGKAGYHGSRRRRRRPWASGACGILGDRPCPARRIRRTIVGCSLHVVDTPLTDHEMMPVGSVQLIGRRPEETRTVAFNFHDRQVLQSETPFQQIDIAVLLMTLDAQVCVNESQPSPVGAGAGVNRITSRMSTLSIHCLQK